LHLIEFYTDIGPITVRSCVEDEPIVAAFTDTSLSRVAGFQHHLLKPFVPEELDALLAKAASQVAPEMA